MSRKDNVTLLHTRIAPNAMYALTRLILGSCRVSTENASFFVENCKAGRNAVFACWHSRLLTLPYYYYHRYGFTNLTMMVSRSRDGEIIKRLVAKFGIDSVRGSRTRGGSAAIKTLVRIARSGRDTALALDGSKGPPEIVQPGVLMLAQLTGVPLIPLTVDASPKIHLNTWDRLVIPMPFARVHGVFADPMFIPRATRDLTPYVEQLQHTMRRISARAAEAVGSRTPPPSS
jgi:lysophospholipid acyltransferase (LPLAT)-like uncharacterized protein